MVLLSLGVLLWSCVHFVPSLAPGFKVSFTERFGENIYKAVFSLCVVGAILLMVMGWRSEEPSFVYSPLLEGHPAATAIVYMAFLLFGFAQAKTNVKRYLRHPQLTGIAVWASGHLLANGDSLSAILFGGLGIWAIIEIVLINRREGPWRKPAPVPLATEVRTVLIGSAVFVGFGFAHPYLFGVSPPMFW